MKLRKSDSIELKKFCIHAKKNDFIEITEWVNGEGFEVRLDTELEPRILAMTTGEIEALYYLFLKLYNGVEDEPSV